MARCRVLTKTGVWAAWFCTRAPRRCAANAGARSLALVQAGARSWDLFEWTLCRGVALAGCRRNAAVARGTGCPGAEGGVGGGGREVHPA
eukprot:gene8314-biopygen1585